MNRKIKVTGCNQQDTSMNSEQNPMVSQATIARAQMILACSFTVLSLAVSALAQPAYSVTELGVLAGCRFADATSINDNGEVAGYCTDDVNVQATVAVVWHGGTPTILGRLAAGSHSRATAINSIGAIIGDHGLGDNSTQSWVTTALGLNGFSPDNSLITHLISINDGGAICGHYAKAVSGNADTWRGSIWTVDPKDAGQYHQMDLPVLAGLDPKSKAVTALPLAFNQAGQAAGYAENEVVGQHACFWNNDTSHSIADLGTLPGDLNSIAYGMNNWGQVVGESHSPIASHPVVWNNDAAHSPTELPVLPGDDSGSARAINNLGHILGTSVASLHGTVNAGSIRTVLWRDGGVFELQALLDASGAGWRIESVSALNNLGQIVGTGIHNGLPRAFVLTPVQQRSLKQHRYVGES
jgi:uncharacterized membrane protein